MITGSCLCGQLSYTCDESAAQGGYHCHCTDCRKATGSGKASIVNFPKSAVVLSGEVKIHEVVGTNGSHIQRGFCPNCGGQLLTYVAEMPDIVFIKAGTMDQSDWVQFSANLWCSTAPAWSPADDRLPSFDQNPTG